MKKKINKKLKIKRNGEEWILDRKRVICPKKPKNTGGRGLFVI